MNLQRPNHLDPEIRQLKQLFLISRDICRQRALELLPSHPNPILFQIIAACQSLDQTSRNYLKAIEFYQKCLEIHPEYIAFYNNLAKNYIEIQDFHMAATFLNDIKQKWNHPTIYFNLAVAYERGKVKDTRLLDEAVSKMDSYRIHYPDYQAEHQKGLIHTFLLQPDQNYNQQQIKQFETEIFQSVIAFQNMMHMKLDVEEMKKVLQGIRPQIMRRIERQAMYGIKIDNSIKAIMQVFETFRTKLIPLYRKEWGNQLEKLLLEAIRIANTNIFEAKIDNNSEYQLLYEQKIEPCLIQLEVIANDLKMQIADLQTKKHLQDKKPSKLFQQPQPQADEVQLRELKRKDEEITKLQRKDKLRIFERIEFPSEEYEFHSRFSDVEQLMAKYQRFMQESLRVEGECKATPLFLIFRLKQQDINSYYAYYNSSRIKTQLIKSPEIPNLQNLKRHAQRNKILKYYHVFNLVFKFYYFYATSNFQYMLQNNRANLDINQYITLITPVLNQFFDGQQVFGQAKFGWIFNQIHFSVSQYLQNIFDNPLKAFKAIWKRIYQIQEASENGFQALINDILKQNHQIYLKHLLNNELSKLNGSTKQHFYFNWKMNKYHILNPNKDIRSAFKEDDDWIISNVSLLLITLAEKPLAEDSNPLAEAFTDCFYKASLCYKEEIIKKFYLSNHQIPVGEKCKTFIKKIIKFIVPFELKET